MLACTAAGKHQVRPRGGAATEDQGWRHSASCLPILARIYGSSRSSRITSVRKCRIARAILNDPRRYRGCEQHGSEPLDTKIARPVIQTLSRQATHGLSRSPMHQHRTTAYAIHTNDAPSRSHSTHASAPGKFPSAPSMDEFKTAFETLEHVHVGYHVHSAKNGSRVKISLKYRYLRLKVSILCKYAVFDTNH